MSVESLPENLKVGGFVVLAVALLLLAISRFIKEIRSPSSTPKAHPPIERISTGELQELTATGQHRAITERQPVWDAHQAWDDLDKRMQRLEERLQKLDAVLAQAVALLERLEQENQQLREIVQEMSRKMASLETSVRYLEEGRRGVRAGTR